MSRIGRKPIAVPSGVDVTLDNTVITVKGPKGSLTRELHKDMKVQLKITKLPLFVRRITNCIVHFTAQPAPLSTTW